MPTPTIQEILTREQNDTMVSGQIKYLSTAQCYDLWSQVYDNDGNMLQALDSIQMTSLLPSAVSATQSSKSSENLKAIDLGCGTGRNTLRLIDTEAISTIVGLELSEKMMAIARSSCEAKLSSSSSTDQNSVIFEIYDMLASPEPPQVAINADLVVSTLVLEHVPLESFFPVVSRMLRPGGVLLLTNMHARMGNISQAGFVDPKTGDKIRPTSYAHEVEDVIRVAADNGLVLERPVKEVGVDEESVERLGARGKKWLGVTVWFGGIWKKETLRV